MNANRTRRAFAALVLVGSLALGATACIGDDTVSSSEQSKGSDVPPSTKSTQRSDAEAADATRLPCRISYPSNTLLDECGLRFQEQTVVHAKLNGPTKIYTEFDSENQLLNSTVNCAAERCAQPAPANTPVQIVCFEGDRFGIVAPPKHIIDPSNVTRFTTSKVGGKHVPGFEGEGPGVPIGFVDHSDIANLDEVSGELSTKLEDRFGSMSCRDLRIVVTDNMHRNGWNTVQSAKKPVARR